MIRVNLPSSINIEQGVKAITYTVSLIGFSSISGEIGLSYSLSFLCLFLLSLFFEYKRRFYLPRWVLNGLSLSVIGFTVYRLELSELVVQIIETLLILLGIKLLEEKKFRDYMQIYAINLLLLTGLGLLSLDIIFSVYLLVLVTLLTVATVLLTYYSESPELVIKRDIALKIILKSMYIPMLAIPLTVLMFVILPRTQYPIFSFLNRAEKAKIGFTDNVRLGGVSGIQEDSSAILRVNMDRIDPEHLYWRGVALDHFDGISWKSGTKEPISTTKPIPVKGIRVHQTIYLEPYENIYLFALDKPIYVSLNRARRYTNLTFTSFGFIEKRIRYEAISILSDTIMEERIDEERYLKLPEGLSPKIKDLVGQLIKGKGIEEGIHAIIGFLNSGSYRYSLENLPITKTPIEDFLFKFKYGNCEYFASACAIMLRVAGIPTRLIGGYKGGYYNEVGRYYLVPQKNAHVWVEAYVRGKGWVRVDPTPGSIEAFSSPIKAGYLFRMGLFLDTLNYYWLVSVINYNLEKQLNIIHTLKMNLKIPGIKSLKGMKKGVTYGVMLILGGVVLSILAFFLIRASKNDYVEKSLLTQFLQKMEKKGYKKEKSQGLEEFVLSIGEDKLNDNALLFVKEFEKIFYQDKPFTGEEKKRLKEILKKV
ncbi:MAG: DUF3488 and transglutaminase-like domain-containing protein [Syntrophorhabdaceae bacterium]|nr:DUF3488 and transglutaminase-like domain-containing protein [Syntrophorhabdaceae bacterium]